jgi:hypothetical protein
MNKNQCFVYQTNTFGKQTIKIQGIDVTSLNVYFANHPTHRMVSRNIIYATHRESYSL